jgi:hypothetical protein
MNNYSFPPELTKFKQYERATPFARSGPLFTSTHIANAKMSTDIIDTYYV